MQGRDKRLYSEAEIVRAEEGARRGDPESLSVLDNLNHEIPGKIDVVDMQQILHDCPECRDDGGHAAPAAAATEEEAALKARRG